MGKIKQGILGGFSGKVGPVIGASWKGKAIMRARALSVHNPNTDAQKHVRAILTLVSKFIGKVNDAVKVGFHNYAVGVTEQNAAVKTNIAEAVQGTGELVSLDWTKVVLSRGSLPNPNNLSAEAVEDEHDIKVSWKGNTGVTREALATDKVHVVLYNSDRKTALYDSTGERAAAGTTKTVTIDHSADWAGDSVQVFLFTTSLDGKLTSESVRITEVTAQ